MNNKARYGAFFCLVEYEKYKRKIENSLKVWKRRSRPTQEDFNLAQELSFGIMRKMLTLDYYIFQLTNKGIKVREKILFRIALYQFVFMKNIPMYALVYETVEIAKKNISKETASFVNAILRKLEKVHLKDPPDSDLEHKYSYPNYFIKLLFQEYGKTQSKQLLDVMNRPAKVMVRERTLPHHPILKKEDMEVVHDNRWKVFHLLNKEKLSEVAQSADYYIQNVTPIFLIEQLALKVKDPKRIIDVCAAPGGKLLLVFDLFPDAELHANDSSTKRLERLKENIEKYQLNVQLSQTCATKLHSNKKFDLIILDVPCSNTGVLHKRVEARWTLSKDHIHGLNELQYNIFKAAFNLLSDDGKIWYLTCSILSSENESFVEKILKEFPLRLDGKTSKVLPDDEGRDGGFGCVFKR